jgi:hypothetical protein
MFDPILNIFTDMAKLFEIAEKKWLACAFAGL